MLTRRKNQRSTPVYSGILAMLNASALLLLAGCPQPTASPQTILDPANAYYFEDIPVPARFRYVRERSEHKSESGYRNVNHLYEGEADPLAVKNFYIQYMPRSGWELVDQSLQEGRDILNYRKGQEHCKITVEPAGSKVFKSRTQVRAQVGYAKTASE